MTIAGLYFVAKIDPKQEIPIWIERAGKVVARFGRKDWRPWKIEAADVDGDGRPDLAVGVDKTTRNLPRRHKTIFILGFDGKRITKKWLGSTMGRPLMEFCFGEVPSDSSASIGVHRWFPFGQSTTDVRVRSQMAHPLFTIEKTLRGSFALSRWQWSGFGFEKLAEKGPWKSASNLTKVGDNIELRVNGKTVSFPSRMK